MSWENPGRSLGDLLHTLRDQTARLMRQEIELAKTEISENVWRLARNAALVAIGGVVACVGGFFVLLSLAVLIFAGLTTAGLAGWLAAWLALMILGLVIIGVGAGLLLKAAATLRRSPISPESTVESLQENTRWLKETVT